MLLNCHLVRGPWTERRGLLSFLLAVSQKAMSRGAWSFDLSVFCWIARPGGFRKKSRFVILNEVKDL